MVFNVNNVYLILRNSWILENNPRSLIVTNLNSGNLKTVTNFVSILSTQINMQNIVAPTNSANGLTWLVVWTAANADAERAAKVLAHNEARPLRDRLLAINGWVGDEVVRFAPYALN